MKAEITNGDRKSLFRNKQQIIDNKVAKKDWSNTWYLKGEVSSMISCPITPGSILTRSLKKVINIRDQGQRSIFH